MRKSEERYRLLFNSINDAVFVLGFTSDGLPGRIIEVNEIACQRLGYTRDELLRMSPFDLVAPETAASSSEMMVQLKAEKHAVWEGIYVSRAGLRIPVEISNHLVDMEGGPTILGIVRDITCRKQLEENLERERTLLSTLINNLPDYVSVKDTEGRILITNTANAYVMGRESAQEISAKPISIFFPPRRPRDIMPMSETIIRTGRP